MPEDVSSGGNSPDDRRLLERILDEDKPALEELLSKRCGSMICFLSRQFSYEDLSADMYLLLSRNGHQPFQGYRGDGSLTAWVWRVAYNLCLARARKERRMVFMEPGDIAIRMPAIRNDFDKPLRKRDLLRAIERLRDPRQRVILHETLRNIPPEEIAANLRITRGNCDVLKNRAIERVKEILNERTRGQNG